MSNTRRQFDWELSRYWRQGNAIVRWKGRPTSESHGRRERCRFGLLETVLVPWRQSCEQSEPNRKVQTTDGRGISNAGATVVKQIESQANIDGRTARLTDRRGNDAGESHKKRVKGEDCGKNWQKKEKHTREDVLSPWEVDENGVVLVLWRPSSEQ
ncbi:hypothetical protein Adt_24868 [Abeliophyllum distichum]|uniref:Uncharacterized protein n=1 Tax=Abeliophyllum distichum TaxID=126358 RepID=A0ABD1SG18_9LAMI